MSNKKTLVTNEQEVLSLYLIDEKEETTKAIVSIGHENYRARFVFDNNEDATTLYELLKKIKKFGID